MITIATNNLSPAIHSLGRCLRPQSPQTSYTAQLAHKLQHFYAKQTQFPESQNQLNLLWKQGLCKSTAPSQPAKTNPIPPSKIGVYPDSSGLAFVLLFQAFSFSCFEFVSDFDIRISCFHPTIMQNKPNFQKHKMNVTFYEHKDYRNLRLPGPRKNKPNQTQFQNNSLPVGSDDTRTLDFAHKNSLTHFLNLLKCPFF